MFKLRRMRWEGHAAREGEKRMHIDIDGKTRRKEATSKTKM
jgi:hypothetical protein